MTDELESTDSVLGVISPVTALEFSASLVTSSDGNPFNAVAAKALAHAAEVAEESGDTQSAEARAADLAVTTERLLAIPVDQQTLDNPEWVKFLLYDNAGEVRKALRPFFPDDTHAQMITRLPGNLSIEDEGIASDTIVEITDGLQFDGVETTTTGAPILLKGINDYLRGGMLTLGGIAVAVMIVILMLFFNVRWRLLPLAVVLIGIIWAFGIAGYIGIPLTLVTIAGPPGHAGHRHRLRDPDALADRGGGDHRPVAAPDPGSGTRARPRAVGGDLRRRVRLRGHPDLPGADDPGLRLAAHRRHHRHLRVVDHQPARLARHPRVPLAHQGA